MVSISQWRESIAEQITVSEERKKSKRAGLWEPQSGMQARSIISTRIDKPVIMTDVKSPKRNTLAEGLIERSWSMLDEIESKTVHNNKEADQERKNKSDRVK